MKTTYETHLRGVPTLERPLSAIHPTLKAADEWAALILNGSTVPKAFKLSAYVETIECSPRVIRTTVLNSTDRDDEFKIVTWIGAKPQFVSP